MGSVGERERVTRGRAGSISEPVERPTETSAASGTGLQLGQKAERCDVCGLTPVVGNARRATRLVAESPAMQELLRRAGRFAQASAPVVISGESGTGKEVVARALHSSSPRADKPFVAVNVAALPAELLESELFGHARGAFTGAHAAHQGLFEAANGGALFLDEIGEMPLGLQAKLCVRCKMARSGASAIRARSRSTCGSSARPIATSATSSRVAPFARTSSIGSACCR